jgi:hypothetical protein
MISKAIIENNEPTRGRQAMKTPFFMLGMHKLSRKRLTLLVSDFFLQNLTVWMRLSFAMQFVSLHPDRSLISDRFLSKCLSFVFPPCGLLTDPISFKTVCMRGPVTTDRE